MKDMDFDGFSDLLMDEDLESGNGVTLEYDDGARTITIHRAGGSNRKFDRVLLAKMKPYRHKIQRGTLDYETNKRIYMETYAEAVVIGWTGITSGGKKVPYSPEACVKLFEARPELYEDVKRMADAASTFAKETAEEDEKNSETSSAGDKSSVSGDAAA